MNLLVTLLFIAEKYFFLKISEVKKSFTIVSYRETTICIMSNFASVFMPSGWRSLILVNSSSKFDFSVFCHKIGDIFGQKCIDFKDLAMLVL